MADYEKVVEMFGENLASLLELAKKWLVDFAIDPKKLLHMFQNIRKNDLLGLVAGTHEIILKGKNPQPVSYDEYFEEIFETDYITIPDMATVTSYIKENWRDEEWWEIIPSNILETGMKKKIKFFQFKKIPSSQKCVDFIKTQGGTLTNIYGLAIMAMTADLNGVKDRRILSFDNRDDLYWYSCGNDGDRSGRNIPTLMPMTDNNGEISSLHTTATSWDEEHYYHSECMLMFCD